MNKLLPVVRFNSYFGDWDKNKLKNLASFSKGKGYTKSDLTEQGQPIILYGRLYTKYEAVINSVDTFTHLKDNSILSEGDEVIVPGSGETSEEISRASVIGESGIIIGGDLNVIKPTKKINSIFLALTISNGRQQKELSKRAQGNSVVHLYNSNLKEVSIIFPEKEEQEKIGSFFNKLDKTITLQQQLLTDYKQFKKAMLQQMFPQKRETVPRVRFAEFTNNWKQRKLGEVSPLRGGFAFQSNKFQLKGIPIIRITNILSNEKVGGNYVYYEEQENDNNYLLPDKSAILAMSGATTGKVSVLDNPNNEKIYQNQRVGYFKDLNIINYTFISTIVKSQLFIIQLKSVLVAGAQPNISSKEIDKFKFYFPTEKEEQAKIGNFFKQLDETIDLYQQKLETYQDLKKAMLQRMFV